MTDKDKSGTKTALKKLLSDLFSGKHPIKEANITQLKSNDENDGNIAEEDENGLSTLYTGSTEDNKPTKLVKNAEKGGENADIIEARQPLILSKLRLNTPANIGKAVEVFIRAVASGKITHTQGKALVGMASTLLACKKAATEEDVEKRIRKEISEMLNGGKPKPSKAQE